MIPPRPPNASLRTVEKYLASLVLVWQVSALSQIVLPEKRRYPENEFFA